MHAPVLLQPQRGVSLIELVISSAILLILLSAVLPFAGNMLLLSQLGIADKYLTEEPRWVQDILSREIRYARAAMINPAGDTLTIVNYQNSTIKYFCRDEIIWRQRDSEPARPITNASKAAFRSLNIQGTVVPPLAFAIDGQSVRISLLACRKDERGAIIRSERLDNTVYRLNALSKP